ncbi:hypothetical protein [Actinomyces procaprae]|nr:hypothetical protein [Actinomyces procaprae]
MLTAAVEWVSQNARTNIELGADGHARIATYCTPPTRRLRKQVLLRSCGT